MMNRSSDILFMAEYIKNVLYFATIRQGKSLKSTDNVHYFSIDNELVYENYYADFGPLNLGCVFKYCRILNDKINLYLNKQTIVHYTSVEPRKKANAAFLLGCYGVLYLSLTPRDALKPLLLHGQYYRPFQDATQGNSDFTISLLDCLQAIKKARELGLFNFQDFNYEDYEHLDKIQGGDLNWIVPGKFLAFIGPVDYSVSVYHPPEMYINYFLENNVKIVIRLNKRLYDGNVFNNAGIIHYDLFFPDGSCPPRHILFKFLEISEQANCAIAVHCKAGLGRTGSLIGCYLIKHYKMTSHEAIGWMRICRPGSVIGHQQAWLEELEPWLIKLGNIYRKNTYQDTEKLPYHEFGVYSIAEKTVKQRPVVFQKSISPSPPLKKETGRISEVSTPIRPHNSRIKQDKSINEDVEESEIYIASCDLTVQPTRPMRQLKGCVLQSRTEDVDESDLINETNESTSTFWRKYLCCYPCLKILNDGLFMLAVRCTSVTPEKSTNKTGEKEHDWRMKSKMYNNQKMPHREQFELSNTNTPRSSAAGDLRSVRPTSRNSVTRSSIMYSWEERKSSVPDAMSSRAQSIAPVTTFYSSQAPIIKNVNDAKNFLLRSSIVNAERANHLNSSIIVTPQARTQHYVDSTVDNIHGKPLGGNAGLKTTSQLHHRRRLGRSPSPQARMPIEQTKATNTPSPSQKFLVRDASKTALKDVLSRLKLISCREGSLGAASLGANREAPKPRQAPSVKSDERPLATQGDLLNSIKFQRRLRDTWMSERSLGVHASDKNNLNSTKGSIRTVNSRTSNNSKPTQCLITGIAEVPRAPTMRFFSPPRPRSPKGRRTPVQPQPSNF